MIYLYSVVDSEHGMIPIILTRSIFGKTLSDGFDPKLYYIIDPPSSAEKNLLYSLALKWRIPRTRYVALKVMNRIVFA